jgi:hypothetical protein
MSLSSIEGSQAGVSARWLASVPRLIDRACGFHVKRSSGTLSSTLRVRAASAARSRISSAAIDICVVLS